jgi:AcrR family transcriptional regulator
MDDIAARAEITKRALYQHFRSKDDLIAAALAHSSELALERLRRFRRPKKFTELADWAAKPKWSGGGFTRVVVELADLRGHPARAIARQHKRQWRIGSPTRWRQLVSRRHAIAHEKSCYSWKARWYLCSFTAIAATPRQQRAPQNHSSK